MQKIIVVATFLLLIVSPSLYAQKIKVKNDIATVNGEEYLRISKNLTGIYVNTIIDNVPILEARYHRYPDPARSEQNTVCYFEVRIEGTNDFFELDCGLSDKKNIIKMIYNNGFYKDGVIDIEKAKLYESRNGKKHTERQNQLNKLEIAKENNRTNVIIVNSRDNCVTMSQNEFNFALTTIKDEISQDSKLLKAKQVASSNCLTVNQIEQIVNLFLLDSKKLDFAKYAYAFCYDQNNYFRLRNSFDFINTRKDFEVFLEAQN
ncbi:MAG: DUF4476 domain-containing protein [Crocinitomicaceae bacterium]|nr:DUF4476 domain-containing protein [Crocinitomicaceae bacterium]